MELGEHENVEHATALGGFWNPERFSDYGRGIRERVVPKQLRNMPLDGWVDLSDLLNLVQNFWLASATRLSPKYLGHHPILEVAVFLSERFASNRDHIGGASLQSIVHHSFVMAGMKQQINLSKFFILDCEFVASFPLDLYWEEVLVSAPIVKIESL
jgi:hypothetical protein